MADNLADAWSRLSLKEAEAEVVEFEEEAPGERKDEIALSLLEKLMTESNFNPRILKSVMKNIWKPSERLVVRDLDTDLFLFQFFSEKDESLELERGLTIRRMEEIGSYLPREGYDSVMINSCSDGNEVFFRIKRSTQLKKLMNAYCDRQSVELNSIAFLFDGRRLRAEQTPEELEMEDGDEIDAMLHQTGGATI
ncbi:hypothetical protein Cgig2_006854 [Carnegiea gigantea]|uniref:Ubiquitin-like domain-containing protein n=1 Tax=Carnegiea gigantea TaxID=171969 RepID=A0A9Q1JWJ1_9CARY|nr:hypothetical protein Cgig2_006854 [Carnegiea gigantea]